MDMQFYDWVLTSVDKVRFSMSGPPSLCLSQRLSTHFHFLWCRERITYAWVLSALARYLALVCRYGSISGAPHPKQGTEGGQAGQVQDFFAHCHYHMLRA